MAATTLGGTISVGLILFYTQTTKNYKLSAYMYHQLISCSLPFKFPELGAVGSHRRAR